MTSPVRTSALYPTLGLLAILTTSSMSVTGVAVLIPEAARDIGVEPTWIGVFTAVVYATAMATGVVTGQLIHRYGAIRMIQFTMVCAAAGMVLFSLATPFAALASALALGCAYGPYNPASAHVLARASSPAWRPLVFSVKQTGVPLGGALAGALLPTLAIAFGWRAATLATAAAAAVMLFTIAPLRPRFDRDRAPAEPLDRRALAAPLRLALADPVLRRYTLVAFAYAGCQLTTGAFMVVFLTTGLGMSLIAAGGVFAFLQGGGVAGRILWGVVASGRLGARRVLAGLGLVTATGLVVTTAMTTSWPFPAVVVLMTGLGATTYGWNGVMLSEVATHAPPGREAEATGGMQVVMFAGTAVIPPLFGVAVRFTGGFEWGFFGLAALAAAGAVLMLSGRRAASGAGSE